MRSLLLLTLVWFQYTILAVNYRAVAHARYGATMLTDAVIAICGFTIFKLIVESQGVLEIAGYAIGGMLGGATGIWLTRKWSDKP
jgi:hypothetical protein